MNKSKDSTKHIQADSSSIIQEHLLYSKIQQTLSTHTKTIILANQTELLFTLLIQSKWNTTKLLDWNNLSTLLLF